MRNIIKFSFFIYINCMLTTLSAQSIKTPNVFDYIEGVTDNHCSRMVNHPGDAPFPTDMTFCDFADHKIIPSTKAFDPDLVKKGDTIFLMDWYLPWFVKEIHPKIKEPYIIISNDSDGSHPNPNQEYYTLLYDSKVAAWFCKNMLLSKHPKIFQIPIGQNIIYWGNFPEKNFLLSLASQENIKKHLLYMNMQLASHKSRPKIAKLFEAEPYCFSRINYQAPGGNAISRIDFYKELAEAQFVLAPPGYGPDTVRFWEAISLGVIPIVKHSPLDELYSDLPVLFVHRWQDVNESLLIAKLDEFKGKNLSTEKIYFPFWKEKIRKIQKQVKEGSNTFSKLDATLFSNEELHYFRKILKANKQVKNILTIGQVQSLRPFQLAENFPKQHILVKDPMMNIDNRDRKKVLKNLMHKKITQVNNLEFIPYQANLTEFIKTLKNPTIAFFLDLSYFRTDLKKDFSNIYSNAPKGTLIFGNLHQDIYVQEVLKKLEENYHINFLQKGNFWFLVK